MTTSSVQISDAQLLQHIFHREPHNLCAGLDRSAASVQKNKRTGVIGTSTGCKISFRFASTRPSGVTVGVHL